MNDLIAEYGRYWPYGIVLLAGIAGAVIDIAVFARPVLGVLFALVIVGGYVTTQVSPFSFGSSYYMEGVVTSAMGGVALAGYLALRLAAVAWGGRSA